MTTSAFSTQNRWVIESPEGDMFAGDMDFDMNLNRAQLFNTRGQAEAFLDGMVSLGIWGPGYVVHEVQVVVSVVVLDE